MEIDREILYRFFNGIANPEEKKVLRQYLEASKENWNEYLRERKLFDAIQVNSRRADGKLQKRPELFRRILKESLKIAAILVIALGVAFLWKQNTPIEESKTSVNTLYGQMANVTLPDGTKVWLNSNTHIEFPSAFAEDKREIKIDGEAYFEVAHDAKKAFIVHTPGKETVEVLGTKFYVEAYADSDEFEAALVEGSVQVKGERNSLILSPKERAVLKNGEIVMEEITDMDVYRWREGLICFKNEHLTDIVEELEKYFGVKMAIAGQSVRNPQLTVKFRLSDGVEHALRVLQRECDFSYTRDDDTNTFIIRK